ncbi:DUF4330 domain-containing protein [bacterium]|nr:DUF4330 domain-containing protein [bacterium]
MSEINFVENNQSENEKDILNEQRKCCICNFIKNIKKADLIIISAIIIFLIFGFIIISKTHKFGSTPVQAEKRVAIQVFFRNLIVTENPFNIDDKAFITIRNVPYTSLKILDVNFQPKQTVIPTTKKKKGYMVVTDPAHPWQFDFVVTLEDTVKLTNEGEYVVGGNKLKVGLPIVLEGKDYRFNGVISSILSVEETNNSQDLLENKDNE